MLDKLTRLAWRYGIEPEYQDAFGRHQQVSPETLRALLSAMGCDVGTERALDEAWQAAEREPWLRLLEPVVVARAGAAITAPVNVPERAAGRIRWRVVEESGAEHAGTAQLEKLTIADHARVNGEGFVKRRLALPRSLPPGEHQLEAELGSGQRRNETTRLFVTPARCFAPADLGRDRLWGIAAQLYALRSAGSWGIGDFGDLARLAEQGAGWGASLVGVNPLHALFPAEPRHISPYSPSSRQFVNPLYIAAPAVPEFGEVREAQGMLASAEVRGRLQAARAAEFVDYQAVTALKLPVLEKLFAHFRQQHLEARTETERARAYRAFEDAMGERLENQARFDALHERMLAQRRWSWRSWPAPLQNPESREVADFAAAHAERIGFFKYLQFVADEQLRDVQRRARAAGMPIGLYRDLAVAVHPDGAMAWSNPGVTMAGATVGAPPDQFNPKGQSWGLAPLSPVGLRERAYGPFLADLHQNMRHAGAVRIDHVMGLMRLFWIPEGGSPGDGAYVRYPLPELTRLVALASRQQRCLVVGEDLGTVPPGFRRAMQQAGILSYRVLYFERTRHGGLRPPQTYPDHALITVSTHDLPTLAGFWTGRDLEWRDRLDLHPDEAEREQAYAERTRDKRRLLAALARAGVLDPPADTREDEVPARLIEAVHRFLADAPSALMMLQLEDVLGLAEQANLPGTVDQHPNWRRKLPKTLDELASDPLLPQLAAILRAAGRDFHGKKS